MQSDRLRDLILGATAGAVAAILVCRCFNLISKPPLLSSATSRGASPPEQDPNTSTITTASCTLTDEIISEQLTRNLQFFGDPAQQQLAQAFVVVVGLGVRHEWAVMCCRTFFTVQ